MDGNTCWTPEATPIKLSLTMNVSAKQFLVTSVITHAEKNLLGHLKTCANSAIMGTNKTNREAKSDLKIALTITHSHITFGNTKQIVQKLNIFC